MKVNPFVIVIVVVIAVIAGYFFMKYVYKKPANEQVYTETATVKRAYVEENVSTLEDKTYFVELKTSRGDTLTAEGTVYYAVCKKKVGSQVNVTYKVTTYDDGTNKIVVQDIADIKNGHTK